MKQNGNTTEEIIEQIKETCKNPDLVQRAFEFARDAHTGQKRLSSEDYIIHPVKVAEILNNLKLDSEAIAAGILHDVADDTDATLEDIEKKFGKEVAFLVEGVSKLGKIRYPKENLEIKSIQNRIKKPIELQAENLRKIFFAMAQDLRVVLIKLADRLHNMETLDSIPKEKQKRIALETLEIFAPLADRLGIGEMKSKLEDLAFSYLYPKEYNWLKNNFKGRYEDQSKYLEKMQPILKKILAKEKLKVIDIHSRVKGKWSLYQKLLRHSMDIESIYDLVALRLIMEDVKSCYTALGIIHKHWRPLPGRIKDYIAFPKPNGYKSLHTTVLCKGKIIEIQIRTPEIHEEAEYGICAHWAEKERVSLFEQGKKFEWVKQLSGWQKNISESEDFFKGLRIDFFKHRIFVLTPKGDVIDLPEGATAVDFAFHVHTDIGKHCVGAKINGRMVAISTPLRNGDIVEILTDTKKSPSRDWLKFVKTNLAQSTIQKEVKKGFLETLTENFSPKTIVKKIFQPKKKSAGVIPTTPATETKIARVPQNVLIGGESGISLSFAKCCNPQLGDGIRAYIPKNRGASIHKESCEILKRVEKKWPEKVMQASWKN